ncbi:MAG: M48 family metalloprotease [Treponema sp.]|nr:M48 family metalloprotease [Treponema sp.]
MMRKMFPGALLFAAVVCFSGVVQGVFAEGQRERSAPPPAVDMDSLMFDVSDALDQMDAAFQPSPSDMTLEAEYGLGRAVAAAILEEYGAYTDNPALTAYLNKICLAIVINSPRPSLFSGYHVEILDSDELAAFASPGGHIFLSRGLIAAAPSEDALAAVIAHEISHIQHRHIAIIIAHERTVQELTSAANRAASIASRYLTEQERLAILQASLSSSINTLFRDGYSREQEFEADRAARVLLSNAGYDPAALEEMLRVLDKKKLPGNLSRTHPSPALRMSNLQSSPLSIWGESGQGTHAARAARNARFNAVMGE